MNESKCEWCGNVMYDNERSIRFKCNRCGREFREELWLPKLREQLREAIPKKEQK